MPSKKRDDSPITSVEIVTDMHAHSSINSRLALKTTFRAKQGTKLVTLKSAFMNMSKGRILQSQDCELAGTSAHE